MYVPIEMNMIIIKIMMKAAARRTEHLYAYHSAGCYVAERFMSAVGSFSPHSPMRCTSLLSLF